MSDLPAKREQRARLDRLDADPDILTALAERLAQGHSEFAIAHDYGVSLGRFYRWLAEPEYPERLEQYEFSIRCYAGKLAREGLEIVDGADAEKGVPKANMQSGYRKWLAGKLDRARWGEKDQGTLAGGVTVNLIQFSEAQILAGAPSRVLQGVVAARETSLPPPVSAAYADEELL